MPTQVELIADSAVLISVDLVLDEDHNYPSEISKFPREAGNAISDNIWNQPEQVTMHGFVTDSPLIVQESTNAVLNGNVIDLPEDPVQDAYNLLIQLREARATFTLVTGLVRYTNMAMAGLRFPRNAKTANILEFTANFQRLETVSSQTVTLPNLRKGVVADKGDTVDAGKQTGEDIDDSKQQSFLLRGVNAARSALGQAPLSGTP